MIEIHDCSIKQETFSLLLRHHTLPQSMENELPTTPEAQTEAVHCEKTHMTKCLNCGTEFGGKYCPECGQSAETDRFTMKFIWENLQSALLGKDGGIWFTVKNLFTRPGAMIVEILNGRRKQYFSPFPMLFLSLTLYVLVLSFSGSHDSYRKLENEFHKQEMEIEVSNDNNLAEGTETEQGDEIKAAAKKSLKSIFVYALSFYNNHYTLVYMLTIPLFVAATRSCYGKANRKRYNRAEYVVAIAYALVIVVLYRCLLSLVYLVSPDVSEDLGFTMPFVIATVFTVCFNKMMGFSIAKTAWRSVLASTFYFIMLSILIMIAFTGILVYLAVKFSK